MSTSQTMTTDFETLRSNLHGEIFEPAGVGYDTARQAWNLAVEQRPAAVVFAADAADVQATVAFAAAEGLRVAPQGTGHHAGSLDPLDGAILLRTDRMRSVTIDVAARTARAGAGALWMDVTGPAAEHGLAALAGSAADVGVVGYTLGGGMSWLGRRYGLAANHVISFDVVTADGRARHVDAANDPDLFWAMRGGGGSYAIVTAIEFALFAVPEVSAGAMFWPLDRAAEVLAAWVAWTETVPESVTSCWRVLRFPPLPDMPDMLRGRSFTVIETVHTGDPEEGAAIIAPLRALEPAMDTTAVISPGALTELHMDPPGPVPGFGDGFLIDELTAEAQAALIEVVGPESDAPMLAVDVRHAGGALGRHPAGHGALAALPSPYVLFGVGMVPSPEVTAMVMAHSNVIGTAMAPWRGPSGFANFTERPGAAADVLEPAAAGPAAAVKAQYDPQDLIQAIHPPTTR